MPNVKIPIYQYESSFRTKEIIAIDRARFARAWNRYFNDYGDRGGESSDEAFDAWFEMIKNRYYKHTLKIKPQDHPKYIKNKLFNLQEDQFAFSAFGLKDSTKRPAINYLKGYREKFINPIFLKRYNYVKYENPS